MKLFRLAPAALAILALSAGGCAGGDDDVDGVALDEAPAEQAAPSGDADLADVTNYELTMDRVEKYFAATVNIGRAMQQMTPAERAAFEQTEEQEQMPSLDDMADRISEHPAVESAVRDAGLSPREYGLVAYAMLQAGMAQAVAAMQPGADPDSLARAAGVNPATVAFMRDNAEELGRRQQELAAEMEALGMGE
jgi:hypothetical protein